MGLCCAAAAAASCCLLPGDTSPAALASSMAPLLDVSPDAAAPMPAQCSAAAAAGVTAVGSVA